MTLSKHLTLIVPLLLLLNACVSSNERQAHGQESESSILQRIQKAAQEGDPDAQVTIANGSLGAVSPTESAKLFEQAAMQGYNMAQQTLAWRYYDGVGVPQDFIRAYAWINLYISRTGDSDTLPTLLQERLTPAQIIEAQQLSTKLSGQIREEQKETCRKFGDKYRQYGIECLK